MVVLGFQLNPDGSMKDELIERLKVALASAKKYPNAYVLCTGGGTASGNRSVTEAGQMAAWLKKNGIDSSRIIVENKSYSTVQNATYSYKILEEDYPQVKHLAIVTSDYHVSWGYMAFATEISLGVYVDMNPYMDIVSNAAYPTKNQKGNLNTECSHITQIAGISFRQSGKPTLSQLTGLNILGNLRYYVGDDLNLTITAEYDNGFSRDVTSEAQISDVEMRLPGTRIIRIQYEENGVAIDTAVEIELLPIPRSGTEPAQETVQLTQISPTAVNRPKKILLPLFLSLLVTFAVGWMMFRHQQKKAKQRRRRKKMYL